MSRARWSSPRTFRKHYGGLVAEVAHDSIADAVHARPGDKRARRKKSGTDADRTAKRRKKKGKKTRPKPRPTGENLVGATLKMFFPAQDAFFKGRVVRYSPPSRRGERGLYRVEYEDGDREDYDAADFKHRQKTRHLQWCKENDFVT